MSCGGPCWRAWAAATLWSPACPWTPASTESGGRSPCRRDRPRGVCAARACVCAPGPAPAAPQQPPAGGQHPAGVRAGGRAFAGEPEGDVGGHPVGGGGEPLAGAAATRHHPGGATRLRLLRLPTGVPATAHAAVPVAGFRAGRPCSRGPTAQRANCGPGCWPRCSAAAPTSPPLPAAADAPVAADESGRVAAVSQGRPATLVARARRLLESRRLVVATIPAGRSGRRALRQLAASPRRPRADARGAERRLLATLARCCGSEPRASAAARAGELSSSDTGQRGLISSTDIAPTILAHERVASPGAGAGKPAPRQRPPRRRGAAGARSSRLGVIGGRRLPALAWLLAAWALALAACCARGPARAVVRCASVRWGCCGRP